MSSNRISFPSANLTIMIQAVLKAAQGLVRDFGELMYLQSSSKSTAGFVDRSEKRSAEVLLRTLQKARESHSFLIEGYDPIKGLDQHYRFIIDPLDGTTNFGHAFPHFAISVALEKNGEIICGMVYDCLRDDLFYAEKGRGAYLNDRRIRIGDRRQLPGGLIAITPPHKQKDMPAFLKASQLHTQDVFIRRTGCASLDICYVAAGRLDGHIGFDLNPWDAAAASLLVTEAGGFLSDHQGRGDYLQNGTLCSGNEAMHKSLLNVL